MFISKTNRARMTVIMVLLFAILLAACSNNDAENKKSNNQDTASQEEGESKENTENKEYSGPIIDQNNPLDERGAIEEGMELQREMLKPGFLTTDDRAVSGNITYNTEEEAASYSSFYERSEDLPTIDFEVTKFWDEDDFETEVGIFDDSWDVDDANITGKYGLINDRDMYKLIGSYNNQGYELEIKSDPEGRIVNEELLDKISKSLKKEADGAYDLFYDNIDMDLDFVKFPMVNQDAAMINYVSVKYGKGNSTEINAYYSWGELGSGKGFIFSNKKDNQLKENIMVEEGETKELEDGIKVTEYIPDNDNNKRYFHWKDGENHYEIFYMEEESGLTENDIEDIILSAMKDDRSFDNKSLFENEEGNPKHGKNEKELNSQFK